MTNTQQPVIIITSVMMFVVLSSWPDHSPSSFDECRLSVRWPPTLKSSQQTWPVSPSVGYYRPHSPITTVPFIIITQPKSWYSFYIPTQSGRLSQTRHCSKDAHLKTEADQYHSSRRGLAAWTIIQTISSQPNWFWFLVIFLIFCFFFGSMQ